MKKVAIFDVDGTIFRSSLLIELVEALAREGIFEENALASYQKEKKEWLDRKGSYEEYINRVVKVFVSHIKGVAFEDFNRVAKEVVLLHQDRTYRFTRDLIKTLKRKKYYLLAVSHSPWGILDLFCKKLGFDKAYGKFYELGPNDCFTGKIVDDHLISNKAAIVRRALSKQGLTLEDSVGVGDTESDIPMLELVDNPICFNPNSKLFREAKRNGWRIVVERKDVVYEIKAQ